MGMAIADRKAEHLRIAGAAGVEHQIPTGLDDVRLQHPALPERRLADIRLDADVPGRPLAAPLLISAMTGGTPEAQEVNGALVAAAAAKRIGLVLGSGRRLLEDPGLLHTYLPRGSMRPPLLLANIGAAQAVGGRACASERLVEMLGADRLSVHLNPLQEALQPEGVAAFDGVLDGIERLGKSWGDSCAPPAVLSGA